MSTLPTVSSAPRTADKSHWSGYAATGNLTFSFSDIRLKRDIIELARLDNDIGLYRYRYNWSDQYYVGVMAQEVADIIPDAVGPDGYLRADYGRLGLHLMTWDEWLAAGGTKGPQKTDGLLPTPPRRIPRDQYRSKGVFAQSQKRLD